MKAQHHRYPWKILHDKTNFEHIIVKWNSSSTPELHNLHILSSAGVFKYLPFSIFKLLWLILILTNVDIYFLFTSAHQ